VTENEGDIREVIQEEKSRLRPARKSAERENAKWIKEAEKLLKRGTEEDMIDAIRAAGMDPASPEGRRAVKVWRENRY
jgi:hypothetical protein